MARPGITGIVFLNQDGHDIRVGKNRIAAMCILLLPMNHSFNFQLLCLTRDVGEVSKIVLIELRRERVDARHDLQSFGISVGSVLLH